MWKGCSLRKKPDGGDSVMLSPDAMHLSAMLQLNTTHKGSLVQRLPQETVQDHDIIEFMVMGRCRHLLDGYSHTDSQRPSGQMAESPTKLHAELK